MRQLLIGIGASAMVISALAMTGVNVSRELSRRSMPDTAPFDSIPNVEPYRTISHTLYQSGEKKRIIVFSDYECGACRLLDQQLERISTKNAGTSVAIIHFPLDGHIAAFPAAKAALCAERQGKFADYHKALFSAGRLVAESWITIAKLVEMPDIQAFDTCIHSDSIARVLEGDLASGRALGVVGTPTILVDNELYVGSPSQGLARVLKKHDEVAALRNR